MRVLELYPWVAERFAPVKETADGTYVNAECPFGPHPSGYLRFWIGEKNALLFTCWAGCNKLEILRTVGAKWTDCWPGDTDWKGVKQEVTARYKYKDEMGRLLYETVRLEPGRGGKDKDFRQRRPKDGGGWEWSLGNVRRVLYQLQEIVKAEPSRVILKVGGEKDCETLRGIGVLATTNVCGEKSDWLDSYSLTLTGRDVVVIEDRDETGRRHANEAAGSLLTNGVRSLRRSSLPAKDATAFINGLRTEGVREKKRLKAALWAALQVAPRWQVAGV